MAKIHTIASTLESPSTSNALVPGRSKQDQGKLAVMLMALASHYYRPDFSPSQAAQMVADFVEDLAAFPLHEVETAILQYRRDPSSQYFPKTGQLRGLVLAARAERAKDSRISSRPVADCRPLRWWEQQRRFWKPHWREADAPDDALVRDEVSGNWRKRRLFS